MEHRDRRKSDNPPINADLLGGFLLANVVVCPIDSEVIVSGQKHHLTPKAIEVLLFMCSRPNQLLSTQKLLIFGWGEIKNKRQCLTHIISEIRHALDDHKESPEFIQTINKRGYRLIAPVTRLDGSAITSTPQASQEYTAQVPTAVISDSKWHLSFALLKNSKLFKVSAAFSIITWLIIQIIAIVFPIFNVPQWGMKLVVLMLVIGFPLILLFTWLHELKEKKNLFKEQNNTPRKKRFFKQLAVDFSFIGVLSTLVGFISLHLIETIELEQAIAATAAPISRMTLTIPVQDNLLAVTPFQFDNSTSLPEYFKSTLQGEIIAALSKQKHFNLVSERAVNEVLVSSTLSDYADKLGARYLLDGKIVDQLDEFWVMLNISDTKTALLVWSSVVKGNTQNLLFVQKELYRQAFNALAMIAEGNQEETEGNVQLVISTNDFKAYDQYIQGKNALSQIPTKENRNEAEVFFLNSLNYDPNFSLASAGLCQTYLDQYELSKEPSHFQSAKRVCYSLTQLTALKEEGYVALGNLNLISGEYVSSVDYYRQALKLNDKNLQAIVGIARSKSALGQSAEAEILLARAVQLEPGYWKNYQSYGDFLFSSGKYLQASEQYAKVTLLKPNYDLGFSNLGASLYLDNQLEAASEAWQHSLSLNPNAMTYSNLGTAYFFRQQFELAVDNYKKATELQPANPVLWGNLGDAEKFAGQHKTARISYKKAHKLTVEQLLINPNDITTHAMLGRYQSELSQCSNALSTANRLDTENSSDPYLYYDIAIIAINCQQHQVARERITKAIDLGYSKKLLAQDIQFSTIYP